MKTAKEWFDYLEKELRNKCIQNAQDNLNLYEYYNSLAEAIDKSFVWKNTFEGDLFWLDVYEGVRHFNPSVFKKTPTVVEVQMNFNNKHTNQ